MTEQLNNDKEQLESFKKKSFFQILKKNFKVTLEDVWDRYKYGYYIVIIYTICLSIYYFIKNY